MTNKLSDTLSVLAGFSKGPTELGGTETGRHKATTVPLIQLHGYFNITDPSRMRWFRSVSPARMKEIYVEGIDSLLALRGEDIPRGIVFLSKAMDGKDFWTVLTYGKMIEEAVLRSSNPAFWRYAMFSLASPIYSPHMDASRRMISNGCLRGIFDRTEDREKKTLALDILADSLLTDAPVNAMQTFGFLQSLDRDIAFVSIINLALNGSGVAARAAYDHVLNQLDSGQSRENRGDLLASIPPLPPRGHMPPELVRGFESIFRTDGRVAPHPWYGLKPNQEGRLVPNLPVSGIHMASFGTLGRVRSGEALRTSIYGVVELVLPHITQRFFEDGRIEGEATVRKMIPEIARTIRESLAHAGINNPQDFTSYVLSHPEFISIEMFSQVRLAKISPLLFELVLFGEQSGLGETSIALNARAGVRYFLTGGEENERGLALAPDKTRFLTRAHAIVFDTKDKGLDVMRKELIARLSSDDWLTQRKAVPKLPSGRNGNR